VNTISPSLFAAQWLSPTCIGLAIAGCLYALAATWLVRRFAARRPPEHSTTPGVTILKPLRGAEPDLRANLATFCRQNYGGPTEIVFGVQDPDDAAIGDVQALIREFPDADIRLVIDPREHGANRKISNLINMSQEIKHEVVVLADSDIRVEPGYLRGLIAALEQPGVGAVSCLYCGRPAGGLWSQLAAMAIDQHFLPGVIVGLALGRAQPCFGSTIALRRQTLNRIGGFAPLADRLADDHALGMAVRRIGLTVTIGHFLVRHTCSEHRLTELVRHELRWARTIAVIDPAGYAGSCVTHALPLALLGTLFGGINILNLSFIAAALACRALLQIEVARAFGLARAGLLLGPVRDLMSFAIYAASILPGSVEWRGARYDIATDGDMRAERE
jgi:ceramide glucosyltransferase